VYLWIYELFNDFFNKQFAVMPTFCIFKNHIPKYSQPIVKHIFTVPV